MILGPGEIINCPSCNETFLKQDLISGNTIGGMYFSDGKNHFPMFPEYPQFVCCEMCHSFFWLKDIPSKELPGRNGMEEPAGEDLPYISWPSAEEFTEAIRLNYFRNDEEEVYLRMHLWWDLNNKYRGGRKGEEVEHTILFEDNLKELIRLKQSAKPGDFLMLAEMHRELGLFEQALELLKNVKEDRLKSIVSQFREKIKQKDRQVFRLN